MPSFFKKYMGLVAAKPVFGGLRTTKVQSSACASAQTDQHLGYSLKDICFVIYGIISEFADKEQFH